MLPLNLTIHEYKYLSRTAILYNDEKLEFRDKVVGGWQSSSKR